MADRLVECIFDKAHWDLRGKGGGNDYGLMITNPIIIVWSVRLRDDYDIIFNYKSMSQRLRALENIIKQ